MTEIKFYEGEESTLLSTPNAAEIEQIELAPHEQPTLASDSPFALLELIDAKFATLNEDYAHVMTMFNTINEEFSSIISLGMQGIKNGAPQLMERMGNFSKMLANYAEREDAAIATQKAIAQAFGAANAAKADYAELQEMFKNALASKLDMPADQLDLLQTDALKADAQAALNAAVAEDAQLASKVEESAANEELAANDESFLEAKATSFEDAKLSFLAAKQALLEAKMQGANSAESAVYSELVANMREQKMKMIEAKKAAIAEQKAALISERAEFKAAAKSANAEAKNGGGKFDWMAKKAAAMEQKQAFLQQKKQWISELKQEKWQAQNYTKQAIDEVQKAIDSGADISGQHGFGGGFGGHNGGFGGGFGGGYNPHKPSWAQKPGVVAPEQGGQGGFGGGYGKGGQGGYGNGGKSKAEYIADKKAGAYKGGDKPAFAASEALWAAKHADGALDLSASGEKLVALDAHGSVALTLAGSAGASLSAQEFGGFKISSKGAALSVKGGADADAAALAAAAAIDASGAHEQIYYLQTADALYIIDSCEGSDGADAQIIKLAGAVEVASIDGGTLHLIAE